MNQSTQDPIQMLEIALGQLRNVVAALDDTEMNAASNCDPWTVRGLASHALSNQLFWAGVVTGKSLVSLEDTMGGVPIAGDLAPVADDVAEQTLELWHTDDVLHSIHSTPAGDVPGSVVILFATIDAFAHAWDLSASVGRAYDLPDETLSTIAAIIDATADGARSLDLIKAPTVPPADASESERLMALIGRTVPR